MTFKFKSMVFVALMLVCGCSRKEFNTNVSDLADSSISGNLQCSAGWTYENGRCLLKIMPVGDSITNGMNNETGGILGGTYRCVLFDKLFELYPSVDFVGSNSGLAFGPGVPTGYTCNVKAESHEGWGGQTTAQLLQILKHPRANKLIPNTVLIHLGMNDLRLEVENNAHLNLEEMIRTIKTARIGKGIPTIFIAQIHYTSDPAYNARIDRLNADIAKLHNPSKYVFVIDLFNGLDSSMLQDGVHPNDQGAKFQAQKWFQAITSFQLGNRIEKPQVKALTEDDISVSNIPGSLTLSWSVKNVNESYFVLMSEENGFNRTEVIENNSRPFIKVSTQRGRKYYFSIFLCENASAGICSDYRLPLGGYVGK